MKFFQWKPSSPICSVHHRHCLYEWKAHIEQLEMFPEELEHKLQDEVREGREASEDGDLPF